MKATELAAVRAQLARALDWEDAHAGFQTAVRGWPVALRGKVPRGAEHSAWQELEHLRLAQRDIYEFCVDSRYRARKWPDDYWPRLAAPPSAGAWTSSVAAFKRDLKAVRRLALDPRTPLFEPIAHGDGQTILRELLLVIDHNAYHVGQLVLLRRMLGAWPKR